MPYGWHEQEKRAIESLVVNVTVIQVSDKHFSSSLVSHTQLIITASSTGAITSKTEY